MRAFALIALILATPLAASPRAYQLDNTASFVGFDTDFGSNHITGKMPVARADLLLDFANVAASSFKVSLDVARATATLPFAAEALRGPEVLNAKAFPLISFQSRKVRRLGPTTAEVTGLVTLRGVTRPLVLQVEIFQQRGSAKGDFSRLAVHLTGAVNRSDFGAVGFADMVGDQVRLDIRARIMAQK
ncbi:MAG: YceI family protein [Cypionkella sp.]|jgi:polyisoprenoid-binding protein YceI